MSVKILYIDMDNVLVDFSSGIARLSHEVVEKYRDRLDEVPGIFSLMDPMPDAVKSFKELSELYDTYILSTAPWENPSAWSDKLLWVKRHLGRQAHKRLILSHHKNLNDGHSRSPNPDCPRVRRLTKTSQIANFVDVVQITARKSKR